jgi:hypothetical protein
MASEQGLLMDARTRAQLRRTDPWEVRGAYAWVQRVKGACPELADVADASLMRIAPLVAEVRDVTSDPLGVALKPIKEARIRRLLATEREDINNQLARIVRLLGRKVNVQDLVATAIFWGEYRRHQIARDYFGEVSTKGSDSE